jgi:hypothetical protein
VILASVSLSGPAVSSELLIYRSSVAVEAFVERRTRQTAFCWTRVVYYLAAYVLLGICVLTLYRRGTGSI